MVRRVTAVSHSPLVAAAACALSVTLHPGVRLTILTVILGLTLACMTCLSVCASAQFASHNAANWIAASLGQAGRERLLQPMSRAWGDASGLATLDQAKAWELESSWSPQDLGLGAPW